MATALKVPTIFTAIDKFSSVVSGMEKNVKSFTTKSEANIARLQRSMRGISDTSRKVSIATGLIGIAIVAPMAVAVKSAVDYETSIASLSAITGATGAELSKFKSKVEQVADAQKMAYGETAKAFELAGSAMPELLKSADALGKVSSSAITLSKASGEDLASSIRSLTGTMNQFSLGAEQSERTINVLAAGAKVGAASIAQTSDAMVNFGSVAAGANLSVEQAVGAVQVLSKYSLFGAEAGTKLRGSILKLQQAGVGYKSGQFAINDALLESKNRIDKLRTAKEKDAAILKLFGAENISTGKILLNNIDLFKEYTAGVTATSEATIQAQIKSATLAKKWEQMKNQAQNLAIKIGELLLPIISKVADKVGPVIESFIAWTKENPKLFSGIIKVAVAVGVLLLAMSVITGIVSIVTGFIATVTGLGVAWLAVSGFITMNVIPIFEVIIAVFSVIGETILGVASISAGVFAAIGVAIAFVISLAMSFYRNWEMIKQAFKTDGIVGGLKAIGATILDAILMPLQQVFHLLAKLPKSLGGGMFASAEAKLLDFRTNLGVNTTTDESGNTAVKPAVNSKAAAQQGMVNAVQTNNQNKNVTIDFKNMPKGVETSGNGLSFLTPKTTSTLGF